MVAVPVLTPEIKPKLVIVAMRGLEDTQGLVDADEPLPESEIEDPSQTIDDPVIVGKGLTIKSKNLVKKC